MLESSTTQAAMTERLKGSVLRLSLDRHGCRVVQRALEVLPAALQAQVAAELKGHLVECAEHMHGNFVLQKCIEKVPRTSLDSIAEELQGHAERLAMHRYGCRALQRLFEHVSPAQQEAVVNRLLRRVGKLARNTYGHNVVRHLLQHGEAQLIQQIIRAIASNNVVELAKNKSSSLVLETCLKEATCGRHAAELESERALLVNEIVGCEDGGKGSKLHLIALDEFGNYVVQQLFACARGPELPLLHSGLLELEPQLRCSATGKHILANLRGRLRRGGAVGGA